MAAYSLYPYEWMCKVRASLPKVKTGCVTCKKRRVKCDECKPICNRCQKSSRACSYQNQQPTISEDVSIQIKLRYSAPRSPPLKIGFSSDAERCSFDSFRQIPAGVLGEGLGWPNWGSVVLQNSESDPALRHAVIALGALHCDTLRKFGSLKSDDQELLPLAYEQYHRAIRLLRSQLQQGKGTSVEATILSCMVLIVFDFMQGNYRAAGIHLAGGVALLRRYISQCSSSNPLIERISIPWRTSLEGSGIYPTEDNFAARLLLSFGYIDFWASCWMDSLPALPEVSILEGLHVSPPSPPENELNTSFSTFPSLENRIREFLRASKGVLYQHGQQVPPTDSKRQIPHQNSSSTFEEMKTTLTDLLCDWNKNFQRVRAKYVYIEPRDILAINCVAVNHKTIETMLAAAQPNGTVKYCPFTLNFREVVRCSRKVYESKLFPPTSPYYANSPFAFTIGIIHPLYITAVNCADSSIRQEAIDMLASLHWKEGVWDSLVMANIAKEMQAAYRASLAGSPQDQDQDSANRRTSQ
jgi:hypothetical protein